MCVVLVLNVAIYWLILPVTILRLQRLCSFGSATIHIFGIFLHLELSNLWDQLWFSMCVFQALQLVVPVVFGAVDQSLVGQVVVTRGQHVNASRARPIPHSTVGPTHCYISHLGIFETRKWFVNFHGFHCEGETRRRLMGKVWEMQLGSGSVLVVWQLSRKR